MCCGSWGNIKTVGLFICVFWSFSMTISGNYEMASSLHYFCPFSKWHRQRTVCEKRQRACILVLTNSSESVFGACKNWMSVCTLESAKQNVLP